MSIFGHKKDLAPTKVCSSFKNGTKVIKKSTNTPCEITSITVNEQGMADLICFQSLEKNDNGVHLVSGGIRFNDFINEFAW